MSLPQETVDHIRKSAGYVPQGRKNKLAPKNHGLPDADAYLIPLTRGYSTLVSPEDFDRLCALKWQVAIRDGRAYAKGHVPGSGRHGKTVFMHRFILGITDPDVKVDHRDGDGLHNWRGNLRTSTNAQNIRNQGKHRDSTRNKFKGVTLRKDGRWRAQIMCQYKKINLGNHLTEELAAAAYDQAAIGLHGEFARLNFPRRKTA